MWKPGTARPNEPTVDREVVRESDGAIVHNPNAQLSLAQQRRRLPIYDERRNLLYMVESYPSVVVVGHTGCGKTTQIPQYLHEAGWSAEGKVVACTQPRRVAAARSRVAEEMGVALGQTVGYAVRFDDCFDAAATRIKYMTDGRLIRELMADPLLSSYSVVMVDEAHERSTTTDVLLGLLKKVRRRRADLRLIIASATLDAEGFRDFFEEGVGADGKPCATSSAILTLAGSGTHPVKWHFLEQPVPDYLAYAVEAVQQIHASGDPGDVLLFLTGQQEVDAACKLLSDSQQQGSSRSGGKGKGSGGGPQHLVVLPLYSSLSAKAQLKVFEPAGRNARKIVVATNIAETSLTIDGIVHVVDCGFAKQRYAHPSGEEALVIAPISQASARQRAGRAGRSRPGNYYALMTEASFDSLPLQTSPEMQRCSLSSVVLSLKALGVDNVLRFDFLSPPPPQSLANALEALYALGALDGSGKLTNPRGESMALLPLDPQPAAFLLSAEKEGCEEEALTLAAVLSVQSPFNTLKPADLKVAQAPFAAYEGDAITFLNVVSAYHKQQRKHGARKASQWCRKRLLNERVLERIGEVRQQLGKHLAAHHRRAAEAEGGAGGGAAAESRSKKKKVGGGGTTGTDAIRRALVGGYFASAARHDGGGYYTSILRGSPLKLHPNSVLYGAPADWVLLHEMTYTTVELILSATKVNEEWLAELAPHFYAREEGAKPAAADGLRMEGAPGSKRPREEEPESGPPAPAPAPAGGVAAMLGESLFGGGGRTFF